jgi:hypothetical protein
MTDIIDRDHKASELDDHKEEVYRPDIDTSGIDEEIYRPDIDTSGIDEKKLMRRVDWRVIPWLALLYLLSFMDRGNIGNAKVRHLPSSSCRQAHGGSQVVQSGKRLGH